YVYLPGYLGRDRVAAARRVFIDAMQKAGALVPDRDPMDGVAKPGAAVGFAGGRLEKMFENWHAIHDVLYTGPMIAFFERFFEEEVRHYDFTWTRQVNPGPATPLHSDVVYMGRGTHELYTAWTPMGDNSFDLGGLIVLEGSNNHRGLAKSYFKQDVDAFCENKPDARSWGKNGMNTGSLHGTANQLRRSLGAQRWVTSDYKMGDVVLFSVYTVHGGTDNRSDRVRLSTDTRYQRASAPADERWIGAAPAGHGASSRRGLIC
ncbi:MAG TPA: phytanoyl-CoA dioxygenase family protein, partial [Tepidisphaeraceae bacterium]